MSSRFLRYDQIKKLAADLGRPASTLIALAPANDPFAITPSRAAGAKWFARIWKRLNLGSGVHLRRLHYAIVSQAKPIQMPDGLPYENTEGAWKTLGRASNDARYLDLVPAEDFVDRRNDEPLIHLSNGSSSGSLHTIFDEPLIDTAASAEVPSLPRLVLTPPTILQRYHLEIWCEKTTINDVLEPLADDYGLNVVTGAGELSQTACVNLVERAVESGRPVRVLYISDFDPAGQSMPVAVARKIEHRLYLKQLDHLDIQVRPIALTASQCERYRLPRTPIKDTERRAAAFEQRYGEGATELDALEALHSGELRKIIEREVERYFDCSVDERIGEQAAKIERTITAINRKVHVEHRAEIRVLESDLKRIQKEHARQITAWKKRAFPVWHAVADKLEARSPDPFEIDWPEPDEGDEDNNPLFDSTRDYVEQIDRYKEHQGKPIARRGRHHDGGDE
jgi:hypothetical protein